MPDKPWPRPNAPFPVDYILKTIKRETDRTGSYFLPDIETTGISEDILYKHCVAENLTREACIGGTLIRKIGWKLTSETPNAQKPKGPIQEPVPPPKPIKRNRYVGITDEEIEKAKKSWLYRVLMGIPKHLVE